MSDPRKIVSDGAELSPDAGDGKVVLDFWEMVRRTEGNVFILTVADPHAPTTPYMATVAVKGADRSVLLLRAAALLFPEPVMSDVPKGQVN